MFESNGTTLESTPTVESPTAAPVAKAKGKRAPSKAKASSIKTLADLSKALSTITKSVATALGSVAWGGAYRPISGGHVNKRGLFVAAIIESLNGDGSLDTLKAAMAKFAVPAFRAEVQYGISSGDVSFFKAKSGDWCAWALPLTKSGALNPEVSNADLARAFELTCPPNRANVNGMVTEITLNAKRHSVNPLPVFADVVATGTIAAYNAKTHKGQYASKGYGNASFALAK